MVLLWVFGEVVLFVGMFWFFGEDFVDALFDGDGFGGGGGCWCDGGCLRTAVFCLLLFTEHPIEPWFFLREMTVTRLTSELVCNLASHPHFWITGTAYL